MTTTIQVSLSEAASFLRLGQGEAQLGHYNSVRHEFLLICGRGSCAPTKPTLYDSVQVIERTGHSEKPERFREIIDELYPEGRRLELFARREPPAPWERWGNEH